MAARRPRPAAGRPRRRPRPPLPRSAPRPGTRTGSSRLAPALSGRSPSTAHAITATSTTCTLPSTVAEPRAHRLDRVVPEDQVGREEDAGDEREQPLAPRRGARTVAARSRPAGPARAGHRRSEKRRRGGRHVGQRGRGSPEKAITKAPRAPARTGRSLTAHEARGARTSGKRRLAYRAAAVHRNTRHVDARAVLRRDRCCSARSATPPRTRAIGYRARPPRRRGPAADRRSSF